MVINEVAALTIRPAQPADMGALHELFVSLSPRTRWLRYRSPGPADLPLTESLRLSHPDPEIHSVLLGVGEDGQVLAVAELIRERSSPEVAEVAVLVRDDWQGRGLGKRIGLAILDEARQTGIQTLRADVSAENTAVKRLLQRSGLPVTIQVAQGDLMVEIDLRPHVPAGARTDAIPFWR